MMRYETESSIRRHIEDTLKQKRNAHKQTFDPNELASPEYQKWVADRIEDARRGRRLLTEQQYADVTAKREFQIDDAARYVGPSRLETSPATLRQILRPTGQTGTISRVARGAGGRIIFTFMPDIPKKTLDVAEAMDIEVMELTTAEWTEFERIA